jgi:hypothetical protein
MAIGLRDDWVVLNDNHGMEIPLTGYSSMLQELMVCAMFRDRPV